MVMYKVSHNARYKTTKIQCRRKKINRGSNRTNAGCYKHVNREQNAKQIKEFKK